jgi:hypothetical protein
MVPASVRVVDVSAFGAVLAGANVCCDVYFAASADLGDDQ